MPQYLNANIGLSDLKRFYRNYLIDCQNGFRRHVNTLEAELGDQKREIAKRISNLFPAYSATEDVRYEGKIGSQCYMLKYGYAYLYLYYEMYQSLLSLLSDRDSLTILSIGCGSMIDLLGFRFALLQRGERECDHRISYTGVDPGEWKRQGLCLFCERGASYEECLIQDYFEQNEFDHDVIVFPFSIPEINKSLADWTGMCEMLTEKIASGAKRQIVVMTPLRCTGANYHEDIAAFDSFCNGLVAEGFAVEDIALDPSNFETELIEDHLGIRTYLGYSYNGHLLGHLTQIREKYRDTGIEIACLPILRKGFINYKIAVLSRD